MEELKYKSYSFIAHPNLYFPSEDSYMLIDSILSLNIEGSLLEIGCGIGIISIVYERELNKKGKNKEVVGVDIDKKAIEISKKNALKNNSNVNFFVSDLFEKVNKKFDYVVFNPPYLGKEYEREGKEAFLYDNGVIKRFFEKVEKYYKKAYMIVLSSQNENYENYLKFIESEKGKVIKKERYFFEELSVFYISRSQSTGF